MNPDPQAAIGVMAGRVWRLLDEEGPQTTAQIRKKLNAKTGETDYALGWLAREDKIVFVPANRTVRIGLK